MNNLPQLYRSQPNDPSGRKFRGYIIDAIRVVAPAGVALLVCWIYPPQIKGGNEVSVWASGELPTMSMISKNEIILAMLAVAAILWILVPSLLIRL